MATIADRAGRSGRAAEPGAWAPAIVLLLVLALHGALYNVVGLAAGARGVDLGSVLETPLDARVPFVPLFVFAYLFVWLYPIVWVVYLVRSGIGPRAFRDVTLAVTALMGLCYTLWILFPVRVDLRIPEEEVAALGWLGDLVLLNYRGATEWNACPSFHVAGPWLLLRCGRAICPRLPLFFLGAALAIMASTVLIRIHYLLDIAGGVLVAELVFRQVFRRRRGAAASEATTRGAVTPAPR